MKSTILVLLSLYFFSSCTDRTSHKTQSFIVNNSLVNLKLEYYRNGVLVPDNSLNINNNEKIKVYTESSEGKDVGDSYLVKLNADSLVVTYFDNKKTTYLFFGILSANKDAISFENTRNIFNLGNWKKDIILESKKRVETYFTFTFIQEDYLRAN